MEYLQMYQQNSQFTKRYLKPEDLYIYLEQLDDLPKRIIGYSTEGLPIYEITWGNGKINILAWSQMHGNESNSSLAFLDFIQTWQQNKETFLPLFEKITLTFVIMLNPDGAKKWTRNNAKDIDLNRDFHTMQSVELPLLKMIARNKRYDYALNLHEQRTIFSTDGEKFPATISFLAPSENEQREITKLRKKSMAIINAVVERLKLDLPHQIGRYTDEFYPNAVGDNFMKAGIPTILFEGGYYNDDYERIIQRKYYSAALYYTFESIIKLEGSTQNWNKYFDIPENKESHYDLIFRNVNITDDEENYITDIAVHFKEVLTEKEEIDFVPMIVSIGTIGKKGWTEIDCTDKKFINYNQNLKVGNVMNFKVL